MVDMGKLEGKVAFITGAARGQGRSHAIRLAQEGADIIAVDTAKQVATVPYDTATAADLEQTVKEVEALDRRIVATEADVRDLAGLKKAADDGVAALGRLDIVLANAGINSMCPRSRWKKRMADDDRHQPHGGRGNRSGRQRLISLRVAVVAPSSSPVPWPSIERNENIAHYSAAKSGLVGLMQRARERARRRRASGSTPFTRPRSHTPMILNERDLSTVPSRPGKSDP